MDGGLSLNETCFGARLDRVYGLSGGERTALATLPVHRTVVAAGGEIAREGDRAERCAILLEGAACSYKLTGNGRRQILCFHLAGDLPNLQSLHIGITDTGLAAVTRCQVGYVPHDALRSMCERERRLATMLWHETLLQGAIVREWLLNNGRREALGRFAHLACEVITRQRAAGRTSGYSCNFPFTQAVLADALGLSTVHVNRVVQKLRQDKLIEWHHGWLTVLDWERMRRLADFDPAYLHLHREPHLS